MNGLRLTTRGEIVWVIAATLAILAVVVLATYIAGWLSSAWITIPNG